MGFKRKKIEKLKFLGVHRKVECTHTEKGLINFFSGGGFIFPNELWCLPEPPAIPLPFQVVFLPSLMREATL